MRLRVQGAWLPWLSAALLALLCSILGLLQYRWTGEIATAERRSLQEDLQARLSSAGRAFNQNISSALRDLSPTDEEIAQQGREAAWAAHYLRWRLSHPHLLTSAGIETADGGYLAIERESGSLTAAPRPDTRSPAALEIPVMDQAHDRLLVELNLDYLRTTVLPELIAQHVAKAGTLDYDIEVTTARQPPQLIYANFAHASVWDTDDASVPLLDPRMNNGGGRPGRFGGGPPPFFGRRGPGGPPLFEGPERWRLLARHKAGSLETLVAATQRRNLAVTGAVLLLIAGTVVMLIRYTRHTQRLAQLQMNFVTGVSHELRTPLTVIRTAAYNLRNPEFRRNEDRIVRYGQLIENETGKLEGMVDQVMRFAGASAGHAVRQREPLDVSALIHAEVAGLRVAAEGRGVSFEEDIEPDLPVIAGDSDALSQALRNLLDNALKHGAERHGSIGIHARTVRTGIQKAVEITIADKGPGIPADERARIFDPFFRGKRALRDQVRGTGLGLNLVKSIVEAHGGSVSVTSDSAGTRFVIRVPGAALSGADA